MADVGRPTVFTPETIQKLEYVFAMDGSVEEACFYADIGRSSYYQFLKQNPEFADRFDALRQKPILAARKTVVNSLNNPDNAFRYLERKRKNEFSPRIENTGADGKDLIPQPILGTLNVISAHDLNSEDSEAVETDQGDSGRNISEQDDLNSATADPSSAEGQ
jgi:hypothetical protein